MARVTFTKDYDHRWPSRAVTAFKKGWMGTVKAEVAEAAIAKGSATTAPKAVRPSVDGRVPDSGRSGDVARPHDAHDVGTGVRSELLEGAGK